MAGHSTHHSSVPLTESGIPRSYGVSLYFLTMLFFMWGFITCLNDILIPHLKAVYSLSYTESMMIQFCFFGAYFLMSLPAGSLVNKWGYQKGIVLGLSIASIGCLVFILASVINLYAIFLTALFILATGITLLQVSANPYVNVMGPQETAASRLTMTQAFNSLGTTIAPFIGALFIFSGQGSHGTDTSSDASALIGPYLGIAITLALLALFFKVIDLPAIGHKNNDLHHPFALLKAHRNLAFGTVGIFLYVGAEVSIGSFMINFFGLESVAGLSEANAASYVALYWGGAMVGRFIGAWVMQKMAAGKVLAFNGLMAVALLSAVLVLEGNLAMWAVIAVGLFNSIMFPTIFSLSLQGLGDKAGQGSGILCLAIVGGALVPLLQGVIADEVSLQSSFVIPLLCYGYIAWFGFFNRANKQSG